MSKKKTQNVQAIFNQALELESAEERQNLVSEACGGDVEVQARVLALLKAYTDAGNFFGGPSSENVNRLVGVVGEQIGPYLLREQIGEGGMGVVYVAEQMEPVQRKVALKIIKPGMDTKEVIARFEAEQQALAFMEHPNIARVLDAGATESGRPYFVMELVRGIPITEYCDQAKATPQERIELFKTVCDAVQHAHQKGIIHRDIKPSNVLVTQVSAKPVVKVIDFGLAKATSGQKLTDKTVYTGFMKLMGTPSYMSPEQAGLSGLDIDTRSDVYSLGILLYELLTGTTPLDKNELQKQAYEELCRKIREVEAPKPSSRISTLTDAERSTLAQQRQIEPKTLRQLLDGDLDVVVLKALQKDRDQRYESPKELAADLDRFLDDKPILAVAPSSVYLARKYVRRHKTAILTAAAILAFLLFATVFSSWQAILARRSARVATDAKRNAVQSERQAIAAKKDAIESERRAVAARKESEKTAEERRRLLYVANMQSAARIWISSNGNQRQVEELLAAWIPVDEQPDLRDFSWRYQWSQLHQNARQTIFDCVHAVFLPAGNLLTANKDGVREWDGSGGLVSQHSKKNALQARFSFDGRWVAIPTHEVVQLINLHSGSVHELSGTRFTFSSNSRYVACWNSEGEIPVWDIRTEPHRVDSLRSSGFDSLPQSRNLCLAPDGKSFLLKGHPTAWRREFDVRAYLHDRSEPAIWQHSPPVGSWAWSPDGQHIAIGVLSGKIHLQHISRPEERITFGTHGKQITAMTFTPDSQRLAAGGSDGTLDIWDIQDESNERQPTSSLEISSRESSAQGARQASTAYEIGRKPTLVRSIKATGGAVQSIAFSVNSTKLATTDSDGVTKRWSTVDNDGPIQLGDVADSLFGGTVGIEFSLIAGRVSVTEVVAGFSAAEDGRITIGDQIIGISHPGDVLMQSLAGMDEADIAKALLGRRGSEVRLHLQRGNGSDTVVVQLTRRHYPDLMSFRVACSPKADSLAVASRVHGVTVWNHERRQAHRYPYRGYSVAYSSDGRYLAMDDLNQIVIWNLEDDHLYANLATRRPTLDDCGASLAFSSDNRYLVAGSGFPFNHAPKKSQLHVWDVNGRHEIGKRDQPATVTPLHENDHILTSVVFTPDGKRLVAADHDGVIRVWDTNSWSLRKILGRNHVAHSPAEDAAQIGRATAMAISRDGRTLAVGFGASLSTNTGIVLWDMEADRHLRTISGPRPMALAFSADDRTVASTDEGHDVILWDVATGLPLRRFDSHENAVFGVDFSSDGETLASTDIDGVLQIMKAASLESIDRHPSTLRSLLRLGDKQNRERRYSQAERTLRRLYEMQSRSADLPQLRAAMTTALEGQGKLPVITRHPKSTKVVLGGRVSLRVGVEGAGPWSFQWFKNDQLLEGSTQQKLSISIASESDFGSYHIEVLPFGRDDVNAVSSDRADIVQQSDIPPPDKGDP